MIWINMKKKRNNKDENIYKKTFGMIGTIG